MRNGATVVGAAPNVDLRGKRDVESFADRVRDRYLFTLSGLSDAERAVVEETIEGAYFSDDEAFRSVVDRLRSHEGIDVDDSYGTWLCAYEGVEYRAYAER
jgi:hypothetical protein